MKITLTNDFHNTTCSVVVSGDPSDIEYVLSSSQANRIRRTLCGVSDCRCGPVRCEEWDLHDDRPHAAPVLINKPRERAAAFGNDLFDLWASAVASGAQVYAVLTDDGCCDGDGPDNRPIAPYDDVWMK